MPDLLHMFDHETECEACAQVAALDRLAHDLRDPMAEMARLLKAPLAVLIHGGDPVFDTMTLTDLVPYSVLGRSMTRRAVTIVNASAGGGPNIVLGREPSSSLIGAGLFTLIPQATIKLAVRDPLWATPSALGAMLSLAIEEDPEQ